MFSTKSLKILFYVTLSPFLIIIGFLFYFQILEGAKYSRIAEFNFVRVQKIFPVRGEIFDRYYRPIAVNYPSTNLYILPAKIKNVSEVAHFVSQHLPITEEELRDLVYQNRFKNYQEIMLAQNLEYEKIVDISECLNDYPSLYLRTEHFRHYNIENHFTGYVNRISREEYEKLKDTGYTQNCLIGKTGLEKQYEDYLRGKTGHRIIQVDANGRSFELFKENLDEPAVNGLDMVLSIDLDLQQYIESIFPEGYNGAVLVMNPQNGALLSYISRPNYDINMFSGIVPKDYWDSLVSDKRHPLLDRVSNASYPPASLFKTVVASYAYDKHIITAEAKPVFCSGSYQFGNRTFNCWSSAGHGRLNMAEALKHSCNVYFYDLSTSIDLDVFATFIKSNHLIDKTNIDLPVEKGGFFPTTEWYVKQHGSKSGIPGYKVNLAIGQGEVLMTPLEVGVFYSAIANNGSIVKPHFFSSFIDANDNNFDFEESGKLTLSANTIAFIKDSLYKGVNEAGGTSGAARLYADGKVSGKTGTAQNPMGKNPHTWFAGYAEWDGVPEISVIVFIENFPGSGGSTAAPLAGKIFKYYQDNVRIIPLARQ